MKKIVKKCKKRCYSLLGNIFWEIRTEPFQQKGAFAVQRFMRIDLLKTDKDIETIEVYINDERSGFDIIN